MRDLLLAAGCAIGAVAAVCLFLPTMISRPSAPEDSTITIERPEWMRAPAPAAPAAVPAEQRESVAAAIVPPETLATTLVETKAPVRFGADALCDAGIAREVAEGMVRAIESMTKTHGASDGMVHDEDFVLAIWPDLPRLIREGQIKPKVVEIPTESRGHLPLWTFTWSKGGTTLRFCINTANWQVQMLFTDSHNPLPELFAKAMEVSK